MKHSRRALTKKGLKGLRRGKSKDGKLNSRGFDRWWLYKGEELETLREVVLRFKMDRLGISF